MKSTSPPAGVQARPMATPGCLVRSSISSSRKRGAPSIATTTSGVTASAVLVAFRAPPGGFPADRPDLALEVAHAGLARVSADHAAERGVGKRELFAGEAVVRDLLLDEVLAGNLQLLFFGVPGELEHLHAVAQGRRHRIEHVRGRDEQHLRQVERHVEVVIAERVVLLGIEHLEQGRAGIAPEVGPELVDLVEDEHRVLRLRAPQPLDDLPRQRADVRAAMPADLGLVAHAAERDAHELAIQRRRDGLRQRGLAHAGRARRNRESGPSRPD